MKNHFDLTFAKKITSLNLGGTTKWQGMVNDNKSAFTLSEVLITIGIIGVIAAITMPVLINKYQDYLAINKVKKWYSMTNQAILMSINDNGYLDEWQVTDGMSSQSANDLAKYIKPYLNIVKDCGTSTDVACAVYGEGYKFYELNQGALVTVDAETSSKFYKIILSDGSHIFFRGTPNSYCKGTNTEIVGPVCGAIFVDINGNNKPNIVGKDIFGANLVKTGLKLTNYKFDCSLQSGGWSCLSWIITHNNLNYPKTLNESE